MADPEKIRALHSGTPHSAPLPDPTYWTHGVTYPMDKQADLDALYIQAGKWSDRVARITDGALEVRTPVPDTARLPETDIADHGHAYFWFPDFVEGDVRLDYDFQILEPGGLSLIMVQAAGIHGERFLEDYPRRTSGAMRMVAWEDVRNYHLEYYREMDDVRNDLATFALVKNPWLRPLGYATRTWQWQMNRWYHLCFAQQEGSLRLFIDDDLVIDARDDAFNNNGPLLQRGYVALRCMFRTAMRFKDVSIRWRPLLSELRL